MRSVFAAAWILSVAGSASAAPCTDYGSAIRWVRGLSFGPRYPNGHTVQRLEIVHGTAFLAASSSGLQVFSLADPSNPRFVAARSVAGPAVDVLARGNLLALAVYGSGSSFVLYDITVPGAPVERGLLPLGFVRLLGFHDDRVVVDARPSGVRVVDVSNPDAPVDLGPIGPSSNFTEFAFVSESPSPVAYSASRDDGIVIWDFSTPLPTRWPGLPGPWTHVARDPERVGTFAAGFTPEGAIFVSSLDVSDPFAPREIDTIKPEPARPNFPSPWPHLVGLKAVAGRVIVSSHYAGNLLVDATDPADLQDRGGFKGPAWTSEVELFGGHLYVAENLRGIHVYAVDAFEVPRSVGHFLVDPDVGDPDVDLLDVEVVGDFAYGVEQVNLWEGSYPRAWWQAEVVDLSSPRDPTSVGTIVTEGPFPITDFHVAGGDLFATWVHRLHTMSLEDPRRPTPRGTVSIPGPTAPRITALAAVGSRLYAAAERTPNGAVVEFDVSDPDAPRFVGSTAIPGRALAIAVRGDRAYLAAAELGVVVADLSAAPPSVIGWVGVGGVARDIEIRGDVAYVALGEDTGGLGRGAVAVLDLHDPDSPAWRGEVRVPHAALDVALRGDFAYVAAGRDGVIVLDLRDPFVPIVRGGLATGTAPSIVRSTRRGVVAASLDGLWVLPVDCSQETRPEVAPDPPVPPPRGLAPTWITGGSRPGGELAFRLASEGETSVAVFDVAGRRVRDMKPSRRPAGEHRIAWDGRDDRGRSVPAGVYFVRLRTEQGEATRKAVVRR